MKKFFSLIAAVLFAGSMMAQVTITPSALTAAESTEINATIEGVSLNITQGTVTADQIRIFKNQTITISAESNITSIVFTCTAKGAAKYGPGCFTEQDGYTFEADGFTGTWTGSATSVSFVASANQVRASQIVVTLEGGEVVPPTPADTYTVAGNDAAIFGEAWNPALTANDMTLANGLYKWEKANLNLTVGSIEFKVVKNHSWDIAYPAQNYVLNIAEDGEYTITITFDPTTEAVAAEAVKNEPLADPTNCAEAAEAALSVSANNELYNNGAVYTIEGYVTGIKTAYSDQYHNISFWMADAADGGEVLQAYRAACASEADAPQVGDKVAVTGSLTKYNTTPEFAAGCTYVITEPYIPVEPEINYYVVGSMTSWAINADYKLAANSANEGEFMGEFAFENGAEFKVVSSADGEAIVDWFPAGMNNNYQITEAGEYNVYFRPEGGVDGWHEGYINAIKKETPIVHQYEVAEAIAAGLQDDEEILVRGVITKMEFKGKNFAKYGSVNIYVADATDAEGEFEFYNCYSLNADTFRTSIPNYDPESTSWAQFNEVADANGNAIHVGDTVIAFGKYKLYNSTHELNTGCYLVDIKHAPQVPADTITIDIEDEVEYIDMVAAQGWWQFMYEDAEYSISISNASTTQAAGVYTVADLDADYTYIVIKATETEVHFVDGSLTLTESEDGSRTIEGIMTGDDGKIYNIKLVFVIPTAKTTVNVEIPKWALVDASEYYGFAGYIFAGETADKNIYVQITIPGNNPLGTFTYDDCYANGTGIEVAGDYKGIYSMNFTVTAGGTAGAERAFVTADILCYNNTLYHVTTLVGEGVDAIEAAEQAVKAIVNGQVVVKKAGKTYNMNGAVIR